MKTFLTALLILVPALILMFSAYHTFRQRMQGKSVRRVMRVNVATFLILIVAVSVCAFAVSAANESVAAPAETAEVTAEAAPAPASDSGSSKGMGLLAAALVTAISGIGGGIAVAAGAPAAIAATSEDPKSFGKSLIFVALGESIALYGVVISILILNKV
jgi:V/A-type H+-transporting ATPase subunit K